MRSALISLATACALVACGGSASSSTGGSGSTGSPDSGTAPTSPPVDTDGGTTVQPPATDAGTTVQPPTTDGGTTVQPPATDGGTIAPPPATDGGTASNDCDGILPSSLGASVTATITDTSTDGRAMICWDATSDESGNVTADDFQDPTQAPYSSSKTWHIWSAQGAATGLTNYMQDLFPQDVGFESIRSPEQGDMTGTEHFVRIDPRGYLTDEQPVASNTSKAHAFRAWPNGLLVVRGDCAEAGPPGSLQPSLFDRNGNVLLAAEPIEHGGCNIQGAVQGPSGDFVVFFTSDDFSQLQGQWWSKDGGLRGAIFNVTPISKGPFTFHALVDGRIAIKGGQSWLGVLAADGGTSLQAAPAWLSGDTDFTIVRGEKAYARIPRSGSLNHLDLFSASGNSCGTVTFPGVAGLTTGADGTVIGASGPEGCTKTWWPALLK